MKRYPPVCLAVLGILTAAACAGPPVYRPPPGGSQILAGPAAGEATEPVADGERPVLTVVTLEDARPAHHRMVLSTWLEEYDGYTGEAMTRDRAYRGAVHEMASDALADALSDTGLFAEVRRAGRADRADGDLVLTGRLRRLRGWQAYRVEKDAPARILESIGDVFVDEIVVVEAATGRIVFIGQTGAMLEEPPDEVDPYAAAQAAFDEAAGALARRMASVDLAAADLAHEVRLGATPGSGLDGLLGAPPPGWRGERLDPGTPKGWEAETPCEAARLEDETRWFFHPRLGFYRPNLRLWICPVGWTATMRLSGDDAERFPASVAGFDSDGRAYVMLTLGKSSWPAASTDLVRHFSLAEPDGHVLSLPADAAAPVRPQGPPSPGP